MRSRYLFALPLLFAVASHANPAHDHVKLMPESQRKAFFAKYLTRSGEKCAKASKTFYQGSDKSGAAFWNVACDGGGNHVVLINNDASGSSKVMDCKVLKVLKLTPCFTKF